MGFAAHQNKDTFCLGFSTCSLQTDTNIEQHKNSNFLHKDLAAKNMHESFEIFFRLEDSSSYVKQTVLIKEESSIKNS